MTIVDYGSIVPLLWITDLPCITDYFREDCPSRLAKIAISEGHHKQGDVGDVWILLFSQRWTTISMLISLLMGWQFLYDLQKQQWLSGLLTSSVCA